VASTAGNVASTARAGTAAISKPTARKMRPTPGSISAPK
jgi:hypothetical protein